jgi:hypothetical protein
MTSFDELDAIEQNKFAQSQRAAEVNHPRHQLKVVRQRAVQSWERARLFKGA